MSQTHLKSFNAMVFSGTYYNPFQWFLTQKGVRSKILTKNFFYPTQTPGVPWPPDHLDHQDQLDHFDFPDRPPQQQLAKFANILSWVWKQVLSNDNLQKKKSGTTYCKKISGTIISKKKFSRPPIFKKNVRNTLMTNLIPQPGTTLFLEGVCTNWF